MRFLAAFFLKGDTAMVMTLEEKSALLDYLKQKEDRSEYETNLMNLLAYQFLLISYAEKKRQPEPEVDGFNNY